MGGKPTQRLNALGHSPDYEYDTAGRLKTLTNENKEKQHIEYDPLHRLVQEQGLDQLLTCHLIDAAVHTYNAPTFVLGVLQLF